MDRDFLIYTAALLDNCGYITLKKDKRTESIYPFLRIRIRDQRMLLELKEKFGGVVSKNCIILTHRKAMDFLGIIYQYSSLHREKINLIGQLYNIKFSGKFEKERKMQIYNQLKMMEKSKGGTDRRV